MKKLILLILISTFVHTMSYSQINPFSYGIKGGINSANPSDIKGIGGTSAETSGLGFGFHAGFFGQINLPLFYIMPELVYTQTSSQYKISSKETNFNVKKLDIPVSLGYKVLPFLSVFAGPSLQLVLDADYDDPSIKTLEKNASLGLNAGVGIKFSKIGATLRYETGFSDNNLSLLNRDTEEVLATLNGNSSQFILSLMIFLK